jgi:hypothetical protein
MRLKNSTYWQSQQLHSPHKVQKPIQEENESETDSLVETSEEEEEECSDEEEDANFIQIFASLTAAAVCCSSYTNCP